jgi:hypothetical protein
MQVGQRSGVVDAGPRGELDQQHRAGTNATRPAPGAGVTSLADQVWQADLVIAGPQERQPGFFLRLTRRSLPPSHDNDDERQTE